MVKKTVKKTVKSISAKAIVESRKILDLEGNFDVLRCKCGCAHFDPEGNVIIRTPFMQPVSGIEDWKTFQKVWKCRKCSHAFITYGEKMFDVTNIFVKKG